MANGTSLSLKRCDAKTKRRKRSFAGLLRKKQQVVTLVRGTGSVRMSPPMSLANPSVHMSMGTASLGRLIRMHNQVVTRRSVCLRLHSSPSASIPSLIRLHQVQQRPLPLDPMDSHSGEAVGIRTVMRGRQLGLVVECSGDGEGHIQLVCFIINEDRKASYFWGGRDAEMIV